MQFLQYIKYCFLQCESFGRCMWIGMTCAFLFLFSCLITLVIVGPGSVASTLFIFFFLSLLLSLATAGICDLIKAILRGYNHWLAQQEIERAKIVDILKGRQ